MWQNFDTKQGTKELIYIISFLILKIYFYLQVMWLIKQAVIERRKVECPTNSNATDDIQIMNNHIPLLLTSEFIQFYKRQLIERHCSRFNM